MINYDCCCNTDDDDDDGDSNNMISIGVICMRDVTIRYRQVVICIDDDIMMDHTHILMVR